MNWQMPDKNVRNRLWHERCVKEVHARAAPEQWAMTDAMLARVLVSDPIVRRPKRFLNRARPLLAALARYIDEDDDSALARYVRSEQRAFSAVNPHTKTLDELRAAASAARQQRLREQAAGICARPGSSAPAAAARDQSSMEVRGGRVAIDGPAGRRKAAVVAPKQGDGGVYSGGGRMACRASTAAATAAARELPRACRTLRAAIAAATREKAHATAGAAVSNTGARGANLLGRRTGPPAATGGVSGSVGVVCEEKTDAPGPEGGSAAAGAEQRQPEPDRLLVGVVAEEEVAKPEESPLVMRKEEEVAAPEEAERPAEEADEAAFVTSRRSSGNEAAGMKQQEPTTLPSSESHYWVTTSSAYGANAAAAAAQVLRERELSRRCRCRPSSAGAARAAAACHESAAPQLRPHSAMPRFLRRDPRDPGHKWKRVIASSDEYGWQPQSADRGGWRDPRFRFALSHSDVTRECAHMLAASGGNMTSFKAFR